MSTDAKKHTSFAAGETPSRAALAAAIFSIDDIIPVANATEANQVAAAVAAAGQVLASNPVFVSRADARGLHRIEYSYDGTVWIPASGALTFATEAAAITWATSNSAYLVAGDVARVGTLELVWSGSAWIADTAWTAATLTGGWLNFGAPFRSAAYRRKGNEIVLRGSVKSGGTGTGNPIMTLPAGFRPIGGEEHFIVLANAGIADLRIDTAGVVYIAGFFASGNNGVVSLSGLRFEP